METVISEFAVWSAFLLGQWYFSVAGSSPGASTDPSKDQEPTVQMLYKHKADGYLQVHYTLSYHLVEKIHCSDCFDKNATISQVFCWETLKLPVSPTAFSGRQRLTYVADSLSSPPESAPWHTLEMM